MKHEQTYLDLFEDYENQPIDLKKIVDKYTVILNDKQTYDIIREFEKEVNKIGYIFEWYLDAEPYGLRLKGVELNKLQGFEDE